MEERRRFPRERMFLNGSIAFNNRNSTADCFVRNWSDAGAKLVIGQTSPAPREFDLLVPARHDFRHVELVWRHGEEAGVRFVEQKTTPAPRTATPEASRYRQREADGTW